MRSLTVGLSDHIRAWRVQACQFSGLLRLVCLAPVAFASGCAYLHTPYAPPTQTGGLRTVASLGPSAYGYGRDSGEPLYQVRRDAPRLMANLDTAQFDYPREPVRATSDGDVDADIYRLRHLHFPSIGDNGQEGNLAGGKYYESKLPGKKKLVIILPIWGGSKYPSTRIAEGVMERSGGATNVLLIDGERDFVDWKATETAADETAFVSLIRQYMTERVRTNIIDLRRWLDWVETRDDIDSRHIGLVGFSISSIVGSAAYGVDRRLSTGIFVGGGANPDEILATCHWQPAELREAITTRFGWSVQHYREVLHDLFAPINPARFGAGVDPRHVLIFDSYYDSCIPASSRETLWESMGRPERISFLHDHKMSFMSVTPLGLNFMRVKIYEFLDKNL